MIQFRLVAVVPALLALLLAGWPAVSRGAPAVACHCFQDRQFDPARPAAVDPYLLATLQNRLIAAAFVIPRQEIVRSKMSGLPGDRLWVACWVARAAGRPAGEGLAAREAAPSWAAAVARLGADPERLGAEFMARLAAGADEAALAEAVIDQVAATRLGASAATVAALRQTGAAGPALVAAVLLGGATGQRPPEVYRQASQGGSWGAWMQQAGFSLERLDAWLARQLAVAP